MPSLPPRARAPLLGLGFASLLAGIAGGFARLGFVPMPISDDGVLLHGALMASGFFGTVISLERAVQAAFVVIAIALAASALVSLPLQGVVLLALAGWLFAFDIARKTVQGAGLPRYIAICLLGGYAWLAIGGAILAAFVDQRAGPLYDAALHAFFVGFVFSMVFGHAPVIVPAVLRIELGYSPWFYLPVVVLNLSLALRVAGDFAGHTGARTAGSIGNALAIALFIVIAATAALSRRRQ